MASNPIPTPYVVTPATSWDGVDGNWSTFRISVGRAEGSEVGQDFRVLVSTRGSAAYVPTSDGCIPRFGEDCPSRRGVEIFRGQQSHGFQANQSHTWNPIKSYDLALETNLGLRDRGGTFGYDTVRLGFSGDPKEVLLNDTLVVEYAEPDYWMGLLGLSDVNTTLSSTEPINSLIKTLNITGIVPSQSYGYTAGAYYRYPKVPGSLVIGGFDQSRFQPPAYNFNFTSSSEEDRFLTVGLQSVHTNFSLAAVGTGRIDLVADGHLSVIDSTVSQLWLPGPACDEFQKAFGLTYDEKKNYYLINDTTHDTLVAKNPSLTFTFGRGVDAGSKDTIQIELPYAAFDHFIHYPAYVNDTRYFPIRRAENETQYTIGRVFLQGAYLTVNYENSSFSIAQATFSDNIPDPDIRTTHSASWASTSSSSLNSGAKAGIAIGVIAALALILSAVYLCWWRPRKQKKKTHNKRPSIASQAPTYQSSAEPPPHYFREGKEPYDPWLAAQQQQQQMGREHQHSLSEMPAGADNQARRPELDGVNVGGSSYELPAPLKERDEDVVVYEMGVGHEVASDADQGNAEDEGEQVERRDSEQRRPSEPARPSQVETPPA